MTREQQWKLERRVPLVVIVTCLLQLAGALVWATQLDERVSAMEIQTTGNAALNEKFARLEERLDNVKQNVEAIKREMDVVVEKVLRK